MVTSVSSSITTTLGYGSGIDTVSLVDQLAAASRTPKESAITAKQELNTAQISALAQASNAISDFSTALSQLISGGTLFTQATSSDSSILSANAQPGARIGGLSTQVEVRQLAQAQSLVSVGLTDVTSPVGKGNLTLTNGTGSFTITIDDGNNNLIGLARAINISGSGVIASIVEDSQGARLTLKSQTGAAQAFTLAVEDGAEPELARFAFGPDATDGMTLAQSAQNAIVRLDGVDIQRSSNTITDMIEGVTLTLNKAAVGTNVNLGSNRPTNAIKQTVSDYVDTYNALMATLNDLTKNATSSEPAGPLKGDAGIRALRNQLQRLTSTVLASGGAYSTLAEIGVSTQRDGTLLVDKARLDAAMARDPDAIEAMFNPGQTSSNPLVKITSAYGRAKPGVYEVTNLVPGDVNTPASGKIAGKDAIGASNRLVAAIGSAAAGLVIEPQGAVASATITVDLGLGGALKAINDLLNARNGPFASSTARLRTEASKLSDARAKMEEREDAYRMRLVKQFSTMEKLVSASKATQSYLDQQVALWTKRDN